MSTHFRNWKLIDFIRMEEAKACTILALIIVITFFDVIFINKTISSIQVPGVMADGPYGYHGSYNHRALMDPGGSTWGPRPQTVLVSQQYDKDKVPLWNPYQGIGQPLLGNMNSNALNPLRILLYWHPSPYLWDLFLLFRLLLAGIFAYFFMRSIQVSYLPSLFTAILFMFCGYFIFMIDMHHLDVEIFLPFIFLCLEKIIQKKKKTNWMILYGIGIYLTLAGGQPQSVFLIIIFGALYYFFRILVFRENWCLKSIGNYLALYFVINLIGFALSAVLIFPFYEFLNLSWNNHDPRLGHALGLSYDPFFRDFISFFMPYYLGPIHGSWLKEYSWHILARGYWGVSATFFALLSIGHSVRNRGQKNYFIFFFFFSLVLMVAKLYGLPLINQVGNLPLANMINYGKYLGPLMAFCCAVLAGFGLEKLTQEEIHFQSLKNAAKLMILCMLCTFFYFYQYILEHSVIPRNLTEFSSFFKYSVRNTILLQTGIALFFIALLIAVYILFARKGNLFNSNFQKIVIAIALVELFIYIPNPGMFKNRNERFDIFNKAPYLDFLRINLREHRIMAVDRILYPDFGSAFAIGDIRVLDALIPKRYVELLTNFFTLPSPPDRFTGDEGIDFKKNEVWRILNLLGVKYILSNTDLLSSNTMDEEIIKEGKVILAPGQPPYSKWINSSSLTINGVTEKILFAHAPAKIEYGLLIPPQGQLQFSIGLLPGTWFPNMGDGVDFQIYVKDDKGQKTIFSRYIDPKNNKEDRKWFDFSLDLKKYAGEKIILGFATLPGINNSYDWSAWGNIRLKTLKDPEDRLEPVYSKEIKIYENPTVFPRAFVAHHYVVQKDKGTIIKSLKDVNFDLRNQIILEEEVSERMKMKMIKTPQGNEVKEDAIIKNYEVDRLECAVRMESPGFLVLSDLYYPGWNAYVDGGKVKIFQADYILRSVFLESGDHTIKFIYEPFSFKIGFWISGIMFILIIVLLLRKPLFRQGKRKPVNSENKEV